ncbi:MAG TPA: PASTA domain-containing protein, partial [Abditibacterium sp.]
GPSPLSIALRHRADAPLPPSQFNPRCPADLEALALKLLEKNPQNRPDAASLERHIAALAALPGAKSAPITPGAAALTPPAPAAASVLGSGAVSVAAASVAAPAVAAASSAAVAAASIPVAAPDSASAAASAAASVAVAEPAIEVDIPRRRPLSPLVEETLAAQKEEEVQLDRATLRRRHKRREFWGAFGALFWLVLLAGAVGGMIYGAYHYWLQESPRQVRVPNYIGLEQNEAKARLAKAGLTMRIGRETYDAKKPAGTVVSGQPEPERLVRSRREVTVTISQGEAPITMYDFSELSLAQARTIIAQHAMRLGPVVEQFHDKFPRGFICGQFPEAGEPFRRSEPITLIVSRGPQPSEIDATTGAMPPLDTAPTAPTDDLEAPATDFQTPPTTIEGTADTSDGAISRTALIRVLIPADGGSQRLRIVVRDADGEREVYSKTHRAGDEVEERVQVRRPQGATALVRVYVGSALIKEERL